MIVNETEKEWIWEDRRWEGTGMEKKGESLFRLYCIKKELMFNKREISTQRVTIKKAIPAKPHSTKWTESSLVVRNTEVSTVVEQQQ